MKRIRVLAIVVLLPVVAFSAIVEKKMIQSAALGKQSPVFFVLPQNYNSTRERLPVVFYLHAWTGAANANGQELADRYNLIVISPDGGRDSWYFDSPMTPHYNYATHITKEVVAYADAHYRTIPRREARAITGRSMGGHGAMMLALRNKDIFSAVGSIHGGLDIRPFHNKWGMNIDKRLGPLANFPERYEAWSAIGNVSHLANGEMAIIFDCGTEDFFLGVNRAFRDALNKAGITYSYEEHPGSHGQFVAESQAKQFAFFAKHFENVRPKESPERNRLAIRVYNAIKAMGDAAPPRLKVMHRGFVAAAGKDGAVQRRAINAFNGSLDAVSAELGKSGDAVLARKAAAALLDLTLKFDVAGDAGTGESLFTVRVEGEAKQALSGGALLTFSPPLKGVEDLKPKAITVVPGETGEAIWRIRVPAVAQSPMRVSAEVALKWKDMRIGLESDPVDLFPSIGRWWVIAPFDDGGWNRDVAHPIEQEPIDLAKSYRSGGRTLSWEKRERVPGSAPQKPYILNFGKGRNTSAYAVTWIDAPTAREAVLSVGSDDGNVVWLNDKQVHKNRVYRGHRLKQDKIPVTLNAGLNKLLLKVTQGDSGWLASVCVLDKDGNEMRDLSYVLSPDSQTP